MPISKANRKRYPVNWKAISERIRFERAEARCECRGECGGQHTARHGYPVEGRCQRVHTEPIPGKRACRLPSLRGRVVLTVAHLDHQPENCADGNLRAMCQACHLRYDREHHAETRRARAQELHE